MADRSPYRQCTCWADKTYLRIPEYEHIVWKTTMFFGPLFKYRTSYRQPINEGIGILADPTNLRTALKRPPLSAGLGAE